MQRSHSVSEVALELIELYSLVKRDRSCRVAWLLEEMQLPYQRIWLNYRNGEHLSESYMSINPFSKVPGCVVGGIPLFESGAVITFLLERHPDSGFAPAVGDHKQRAAFWKWFFFGVSTLDSSMARLIGLDKTDENQNARKQATAQVHRLLTPLDKELTERQYIIGERFSAVDIPIGHCLGLLSRHLSFGGLSHVQRYYKQLQSRPAAKSFFDAIAEPMSARPSTTSSPRSNVRRSPLL